MKTLIKRIFFVGGICIAAKVGLGADSRFDRVPPDLFENPTTEALTKVHALSELLWPVGDHEPTEEHNTALAAFYWEILSAESAALADVPGRIETYLNDYPTSPWNASLRLNLGSLHYRDGLFTKALESWKLAWDDAKEDEHIRAKAIADRAVSEYALLNSKLGRADQLEAIFSEVRGRDIRGSATEKLAGARIGLAMMKAYPEISFLCGPMALDRVYGVIDSDRPNRDRILNAESTPQGLSLKQVYTLARDAGVPMRMAKRRPGSEIILPSVIHWKSDHFGPLITKRGDRFLVEDGTFGENLNVTAQAIDEEGSGYFLVPEDIELPEGWEPVAIDTAAGIWGRGYVYGYDEDATSDLDEKIGCDGDGFGMPIWNIHLHTVSLNIVDVPIRYNTPYGPSIDLRLSYNQREANEPATFKYSNFGPKWTSNWISAIIHDSGDLYADVKHSMPGGGAETFTNFQETNIHGVSGEFEIQKNSGNRLIRHAPTYYELIYPDGTVDLFHQQTDAVDGKVRLLRTFRIDRYGNTIRFWYQWLGHYILWKVTDSLGNETLLSYDHEDVRLVTKVRRDVFGINSTVEFEYDSTGRLERIIDPEGIETQFVYDGGGDFIKEMITPYGTTRFSQDEFEDGLGDNGVHDTVRWVEVEDPLGFKERVEYRHEANGLDSNEFPLPQPYSADSVTSDLDGKIGIYTENDTNHYRIYRNTFYWDRRAVEEMGGTETLDYSKAHIYQWLHTEDWSRSMRRLESEKPQLENRIYYNYQGQSHPGLFDGTGLVSKIAQAIDSSGTSKIVQHEYNDQGQKIRSVDPVGRETRYEYAGNGIDLLHVRQRVGGNWKVLSSFTDYDNHLPGLVVDAAGLKTYYTYNDEGQILSIANSLNETTDYIYDDRLDFDPNNNTPSGHGYLYEIKGPTAGADYTFTYDSAGRVATITDAGGHTTEFSYDNLDRRTRVSYPDSTFEEWIYDRLDVGAYVDREGRMTTYLYNGNRQLMVEIDSEENITQYDYCTCGDLERVIDPNGNVTRWEYDRSGRLTKKVYPNQTETVYQYDPDNGRLVSMTDALGQITSYTYYLDGNINTINYSNSVNPTNSLTYTWDPDVNRLTNVSGGIGQTSYTYHPYMDENQVSGDQNFVNQAYVAIFGRKATGFEVDNALAALDGTVESRVAFLSGVMEGLEYDTRIKTIQIYLTLTGQWPSFIELQEAYHVLLGEDFDSENPILEEPPSALPIHPTEHTEFDENQDIGEFSDFIPLINFLMPKYTEFFDEFENQTDMDFVEQVHRNKHIGPQPTGFGWARLFSGIDPFWASAGQDRTIFLSVFCVDNEEHLFYGNNRSKLIVYEMPNKRPLNRSPYALALVGLAESETAPTHSEVATLANQSIEDALTELLSDPSYPHPPVDGEAPGAGRVHTVNGPFSNDTIVYTYDSLSRVVERTIGGSGNTVSRVFDTQGRLAEETNNLGTFGFQYVNETFDLEQVTYPNDGQTAHFSFFPNLQDRRLERIEHRFPDQSVLSAYEYGYDSDGVIDSWKQERSNLDSQTYEFTYDTAYRLTSAVLEDDQQNVISSFGYGYDRAGNRVSEQIDGGGLRQAVHNEFNQLTGVGSGLVRFAGEISQPGQVWVENEEAQMRNFQGFEAYVPLSSGTQQVTVEAETLDGLQTVNIYSVEIANEGTVTLSYDLNGNLLSRTDSGGTTGYEWDAVNRLIAIEYPDSSRSEFTYDGLGRRVQIVEKNASGTTESRRRFIWDGLSIAEERDLSGFNPVKRFYSHGVEIVSGSNVGDYFYTFDHLGSIREVTDDQGALVARYKYDPYGRVEREDELNSTIEADLRFTGHFYHEKSGLHLAPYRAYDADLGRWLSRDPLFNAELLPEGPNLYGYAGGNPVNAVDLLGLFLSEQAVNNYLDMSHATGRTPRMGDIYRMPNEFGETPAQQFARKSGERGRCAAEEALEMAKDAALLSSLLIPASYPAHLIRGAAMAWRGTRAFGSAVHYTGSAGIYGVIRSGQIGAQVAQRGYYRYGVQTSQGISNLAQGAMAHPASFPPATFFGGVGYGGMTLWDQRHRIIGH